MSNKSPLYTFKYIIIGDPSVGKSCLLNRFLNNSFSNEYEVTVGVEFGAKTIITSDQTIVKLQIWDTAGQESFKAVTKAYYRGAAVALVVFDITVRETFNSVGAWVDDCIANGNPDMTLVLVGNKIDCSNHRKVSSAEAEAYARDKRMMYFETSAKTGEGVENVFIKSAEFVLQKVRAGFIDIKSESSGIKVSTEKANPFQRAFLVSSKSSNRNCCK